MDNREAVLREHLVAMLVPYWLVDPDGLIEIATKLENYIKGDRD